LFPQEQYILAYCVHAAAILRARKGAFGKDTTQTKRLYNSVHLLLALPTIVVCVDTVLQRNQSSVSQSSQPPRKRTCCKRIVQCFVMRTSCHMPVFFSGLVQYVVQPSYAYGVPGAFAALRDTMFTWLQHMISLWGTHSCCIWLKSADFRNQGFTNPRGKTEVGSGVWECTQRLSDSDHVVGTGSASCEPLVRKQRENVSGQSRCCVDSKCITGLLPTQCWPHGLPM